jgi:subtilisin
MSIRLRRELLLVALMVGVVVGAVLLSVVVSSPTEAQPQQPSTAPEGGAAETAEQQPTAGSSQLLQQAEQEGSVRVLGRLSTGFVPEGRLSRPEVANQRAQIASAQAGLQRDLQGTGYQTLHEYDTVPYIALDLSPQALQAAQRSPHVTDIVEDRLDQPSQDKEASEDVSSPLLAQSSPLVQASDMWAAGYTGSGQVIAVLDTGVDRAHPFLSGKVVEEACYSGNSNCPNGLTTQTGVGSGVHCTYAVSACPHGTHVAGIAAGQGSSFSGVAKGANVMSVQVFSRFTGTNCGGGEDPCALSYTSDQIAGLERVYALRSTHNFSSVNISIGGGRFFSNCDTDSRKAIIDNLRTAGIATVIASGNNGFTDSMNAPGCISSAVSVGSTTKSDTLSSFSNSASFLSLLAPGSSINSSVPGGGFAVFNGTSMATPHVAGAWALLKQKTPSASVSSLLSSLQSTGTPVTDTRVIGGVTKPRINIADAAGVPVLRPANDAFASAQALTGANATVTGTNVNATKESGEPNHANNTGGKSVWYKWTPQASGTTTIDTAGSNFDTVLAVYTGSAVNSLTHIASNDDDAALGQQSKVSFTANAGTTYQIAVDGFGAAAGNINMRLASASTPSCTKTGTANAETISGTSGADVICAGGGNDTLKGLGGNDILKGEDGNDKLLGGVGDDTLDGGTGTDTASYSASLTAVSASLATNSSIGEGSDSFVGVEKLLGSSKADTLIGSATNNTLTGGGGNDTERGGAGNDKVVGSGGADFLYGDDGADTVNSKDGVNGNDSLDGGAGTDTKVTDATENSIVGFP